MSMDTFPITKHLVFVVRRSLLHERKYRKYRRLKRYNNLIFAYVVGSYKFYEEVLKNDTKTCFT